jgi:hypothetical protein
LELQVPEKEKEKYHTFCRRIWMCSASSLMQRIFHAEVHEDSAGSLGG